jgi:hypothetical protein
MGGQLQLWIDDEIQDSVDARYIGFELLRGHLIRTTIYYLTDLSTKNISKQLLIDEHIIDANSDEAKLSDVILITNYRLRIDSTISLLQSWCRQPAKRRSRNDFDFTALHGGGSTHMPIADSIFPPDLSLAAFYGLCPESNYFAERIPRTLPPALRELKLQALHTYLTYPGEMGFEHAQEVAAFLAKVMVYVRADELLTFHEPMKFLERIRALFAACPEDGCIKFG